MDHDNDTKKKKQKKKRNKKKKKVDGERELDYSSSSSSVNQNGATVSDHLPNRTQQQGSVPVETDRQKWLQMEASLEETNKRLQNENQSLLQKEAMFEDMKKQWQNELYSHNQKEAALEAELEKLLAEKDSWIEKEASLETELGKVQAEKGSWIEKEAGFMERISKILDGKASLGLKVASLEENIKSLESEKESWILKEKTTKEIISSLNDDIAKLQAQVVELEETKKSVLQEKQKLVENISGMQLQIQNLERSIGSAHLSNETSKREDLKSELEGERALVAKLISENVELVEKVNELYAKLSERNGLSLDNGNNLKVETTEIVKVVYPVSGSNEHMSVPGEKLESMADIPIKDERFGNYNPDDENAIRDPYSPEADESGEIKQIPLDDIDNEIVDLELQEAGKTNENASLPVSDPPPPPSDDPLPLSDAPLIGAPFRLISFVARYVSGADLVNKSSSNTST